MGHTALVRTTNLGIVIVRVMFTQSELKIRPAQLHSVCSLCYKVNTDLGSLELYLIMSDRPFTNTVKKQ